MSLDFRKSDADFRNTGGSEVPTPTAPLPYKPGFFLFPFLLLFPFLFLFLFLRLERADLDVELDRYHAGELHVEPPEVPKLPKWATPSMERVLADMAFCSALLRAAGDDGTVIYAVDWAAKRLRLSSSTVSSALRRLCRCGAIRLVKELAPMEPKHRAGSRVYAVQSKSGDSCPKDSVSVKRRAEVVSQSDYPKVGVIDEPLMAHAEVADANGGLGTAEGGTSHVGDITSSNDDYDPHAEMLIARMLEVFPGAKEVPIGAE